MKWTTINFTSLKRTRTKNYINSYFVEVAWLYDYEDIFYNFELKTFIWFSRRYLKKRMKIISRIKPIVPHLEWLYFHICNCMYVILKIKYFRDRLCDTHLSLFHDLEYEMFKFTCLYQIHGQIYYLNSFLFYNFLYFWIFCVVFVCWGIADVHYHHPHSLSP